MKRLMAVFAAVVAFAATAATEKLCVLQVTDVNGIVKAATKAGEFAGYPMLGSMASMAIADNPIVEYFGPMRNGASAAIVLYGDTEKEGFNALDPDFALVFPPERSKLAFIASKPGCVDEGGALKVKDDSDDDELDEDEAPKEPDYVYTAFSEDEKWATMSENRELALKALEEVAALGNDMDGDFARVFITAAGARGFSNAIEELVKALPSKESTISALVSIGRMVETLDYGIRLGDAGLDLRAAVKAVAGSELDKIGLKPLEGDAFAFAPPEAISASANAENSGNLCGCGEQIKALLELCAKYGIKTDWLRRSGEGTVLNCAVDVAAAIAYFRGEGKDVLAKIDPAKFAEDMREFQPKIGEFKAEGPAESSSLVVAGHPARVAPGVRFAKTLPEAAAKNPYYVTVNSFYEAMLAVLPDIIGLMGEKEQSVLKPIAASLPGTVDGAIATASWREGDRICCIARISADEIRGIAALGNAAFGYAMMKAMMEPATVEVDEDSDED